MRKTRRLLRWRLSRRGLGVAATLGILAALVAPAQAALADSRHVECNEHNVSYGENRGWNPDSECAYLYQYYTSHNCTLYSADYDEPYGNLAPYGTFPTGDRDNFTVSCSVMPPPPPPFGGTPPPPPPVMTQQQHDFGTVCSSSTGIVQLRVGYRSFTATDPSNSYITQDASDIQIRSYDVHGDPLHVQMTHGAKGVTSNGQSFDYDTTDQWIDLGSARGHWGSLPTPYPVQVGHFDYRRGGVPNSSGDAHAVIHLWLGSTIDNCTVDISHGYLTKTGWKKADCGSGVVLGDAQQETLLAKAESGVAASGGTVGKNAVKGLVADPCLLTKAQWRLESSAVQSPAPKAPELPHKTVQNTWMLYVPVPIECGPIGPPTCTGVVNVFAGRAIMTKTWYWRNGEVVNSAGQDADKATVNGYITPFANATGFSWEGIAGGSEQDVYQPYHGNGRGQHLSSRQVRFFWRIPFLGFTQPWTYAPNLGITGRSDGTLECTGGTTCTNP